LALGEIAEVKGGKRVPKGDSLASSKTLYPYIRVSDMKENYFDPTDIKYIEKDVYDKIKNYTISSDDIYISVAGTVGRVGIVSKEFSGANLTENANKLIIIDKKYSQKYLLYALRSDFVQKQIIQATMSVAQPKLSIERLKKIRIPIIDKTMQEELIKNSVTRCL
jgi:restriction endonuclease S subunit